MRVYPSTMSNRISRVTTKIGDSGSTRLATGELHDKSSETMELIGVLDEANSSLGVLAQFVDSRYIAQIKETQSRIFDIGAAVATGSAQSYWIRETEKLTDSIKEMNSTLEPLREFVVPGGGKAATFTHVARTTVRRAERAFWRCVCHDLRESGIGAYLNRLSDYLFVLSRILADEEEIWQPLKA